MNRIKFLAVLLVIPILLGGCKETRHMQTKEFDANSNQYIFYLTGDGGNTKAAKILCNHFQARNYNVISMDTRYFWGGRTLTEAVNSFEDIVKQTGKKRKIGRITVVGYSFGAEITPFIINNISDSLRDGISEVVLLGPSPRTELRLDLMTLIFPRYVGKMDVVSEINRIEIPVKLILNEKNRLSGSKFDKNITVKTLPGNHHFNYDYDLLVKTILDTV